MYSMECIQVVVPNILNNYSETNHYQNIDFYVYCILQISILKCKSIVI